MKRSRLERNQQQAVLIMDRISRNLEIRAIIRASSILKTGQIQKKAYQALLKDLQPKKEISHV